MATIPWPGDDPTAWDLLFLGGAVFPGLCRIKAPKGGQKIDKKDSPGSDGESTTQQGEKAKTGEILIRMWEREQWDEYENAHKIVEPSIGKRKPLDIVTAATASRGITSILIEDIEGPDWDEENQWMEFRYKWIEHKPPPPKPATSKNTQSQSGVGVEYEHIKKKDNGKRAIPSDSDGVVLTKARKSAMTP
jgi:hypothetical protein